MNTRRGLDETRRALQDLRISEVENVGLKQALWNVLKNGKERGNFEINADIPDQVNLLTEEVSHVLYRTLQEAVENTVKHAEAQKGTFSIENAVNEVTFHYSDDGMGFDPAQLDDRRHYGLQGMQERIALIGGKYAIQSSPGEGTRISIYLEIADD